MTYATYETSLELGAPIELYEFIQGTQSWRYVSAVDGVTYLTKYYAPSPVKRDRFKQTTDTFKDGLSLAFPRDDAFASQFLGFAPDLVTTVTVLRGHYGDPDVEFQVHWKGRVVGAKTSGSEVVVECESVFTSIRRPGLRARYEYTCRHTLYGRGCNVAAAAHEVSGSVLTLNGLAIDVAAAALMPDGYYTGGMLTAPSGATRFLVNHTGSTLTLSRLLPELVGGTAVKLYPGCDHLTETCFNKFNNLSNFGGFPFIPSTNPFGGSPVA